VVARERAAQAAQANAVFVRPGHEVKYKLELMAAGNAVVNSHLECIDTRLGAM
jgi:phosphoglycolate phosphatase-like HAD superfamily hydrolase